MEIASKFEDSVMQHWNNHVKPEGKLKIFLVLARASMQIFKKFWLSSTDAAKFIEFEFCALFKNMSKCFTITLQEFNQKCQLIAKIRTF